MYDTKKLGQQVKAAREIRSKKSDLPFTQRNLAQKIGETSKWVKRLENGEFYPDWDTLTLIADTCGVDMAFLLGEEMDQEEYEEAIRGGRVARTIPYAQLHV